MVTLAPVTVAPVESVTVPDSSPVRSANAGAAPNNQLNRTATTSRTADLCIVTIPPSEKRKQQTTLALLPPGQSFITTCWHISMQGACQYAMKNIFLQYVQNVAVSESKQRRFMTRRGFLYGNIRVIWVCESQN